MNVSDGSADAEEARIEVERLRERVASHEGTFRHLRITRESIAAERDEARAEVERLRDTLRSVSEFVATVTAWQGNEDDLGDALGAIEDALAAAPARPVSGHDDGAEEALYGAMVAGMSARQGLRQAAIQQAGNLADGGWALVRKGGAS